MLAINTGFRERFSHLMERMRRSVVVVENHGISARSRVIFPSSLVFFVSSRCDVYWMTLDNDLQSRVLDPIPTRIWHMADQLIGPGTTMASMTDP